MRITSNVYASTGMEHASSQSRLKRAANSEAAFVPPGQAKKASADEGSKPEKTAAKEKTAEPSGPKGTPPGLSKVQERLQALSPAQLESGRGNALASINRNIARYQEHQNAAAPAQTGASSAAPETPTRIETQA